MQSEPSSSNPPSLSPPFLGRLCIWQPAPVAVSETFLDVHARLLSADITVVHGGRNPKEAARQANVLPPLHRGLVRALPYLDKSFQQYASKLIDGSLASYLAKQKYSAILAEYGFCGVEILKPANAARIPLIVHFHGVDAYNGDFTERSHRYKEVFCRASAIVSVSKDMSSTLLNLGCPHDKLYCVPCGADIARLFLANPHRQSSKLVAVGRMVEKKAPHLTVLAFSKVLRTHPHATLTLIGDGPLLGPTMHLASALGISSSVTFMGAQSHEVVVETLKSTRVFVQHSVTAHSGDSEGTPVSILEALACGIPVVATRHGGIPDIVVDGETGFVVDEHDVETMSQRISLLLDNDTLVGKMSQNAIEYARNHLSADIRIMELSGVIKEAIDKYAKNPFNS